RGAGRGAAETAAGPLAEETKGPPAPAALVAHGIVGDIEVGLLGIAVSLDDERVVLGLERLAAPHDAGEERLEHAPDLGPALAGGAPQRPRVLRREDRPGGVVVQGDQIRPPAEDDLGPPGAANGESAAGGLSPHSA